MASEGKVARELVADVWDEITSKPGEPLDFVRHRKGDTVMLTREQARRLEGAGCVEVPGARDRAKAEALLAQAQAALAALPDHVREEMLKLDLDTGEPTDGGPSDDPADQGGPADPPANARPLLAATKAAWIDYGVSRGGDAAELEKLDRKEIAALYPAEPGA